MHHENVLFFLYKMVNIDKDTFESYNIESIIDGIGTLWLNEKHIQEKLGHENLPAITNKYDQMYKKHRHELVNEPKNNQTEGLYVVI